MKPTNFLAIAASLLVVVACGQAPVDQAAAPDETVAEHADHAEHAAEHGAENDAVARHDILYVCGCGADCDCGAVSLEPGTCDCGKPLVKAHLLRMDGNVATICTCSGDCNCTIDPADPTKCTCGEPVRQISLEGKGLYYCNCGGSCTCNHVAGEPGKCHCGMDLVTS
jgi:hypothetical protein